MSEAITNQLGEGKIIAESAGSQPADQVHPETINALTRMKVPTERLSSKSWDSLESFAPDIVVTVCDSAANESCPLWMSGKNGHAPTIIHWPLRDPSKSKGSQQQIEDEFATCIAEIKQRVLLMLNLEATTNGKQAWIQAIKRCTVS